MIAKHLGLCAFMVAALVLAGCGDDNGGGPKPVTGVDVSAANSHVEIGYATAVAGVVTGGESKELTWSVNGIENGNEVYGTITQNSPVTYNAPDSLPADPTIVIGAVSVEDEAKMDTCHVHLEFTKIFVDAGSGDDATGTGSVNLPVKSITKGLSMADVGMTVLVRPGIYDQANGEVFELTLPEGVTLVGMDWESCIIRGHGTGSYDEAILMDEPGASFRKFTLEMGLPEDPEWDIVIRMGDNYQVVDSIRILERGNYSVLRAAGAHNAVIQNCYFVTDDGNHWQRGYEIVGANDNLILRNCTISGFHEGIFVNGLQSPRIEGCLISGNAKGVAMWYEPPTDNPNPDFGGGTPGSVGGNTFANNTTCGLENSTSNDIYAKFNTWGNDPPQEGVDFCNTGTGSVIVE